MPRHWSASPLRQARCRPRSRRAISSRFRTGHLLHLRDPVYVAAAALWWIQGGALEIERRSGIYRTACTRATLRRKHDVRLPAQVVYACVTGFVRTHFSQDRPAPRYFGDFADPAPATRSARPSARARNTGGSVGVPWGVHLRAGRSPPRVLARFVPLPCLEVRDRQAPSA